MPDKNIDPKKLRQDLIQAIKSTIESYGNTVKEIRQRELKKKELCLLCGNADAPGSCVCLRKDEAAMGGGDGTPMAMAEKDDKKKPVNTGFKLSSLKNATFPKATGYKNPLDKDELHEVPGPRVQGARAVPDKKEPGAVLPGDKDPAKDDQPDEGSGGMKKGEYTMTQAATNHGGSCSWCDNKATHHDTTDTRKNKDLACGDHLHHIEEHAAPIAGLAKDEMLAGQKAPAKAGKTVADLRARANHLHTNASLTEVKSLSPKAQSSIPMGKAEKMDAQTGGRLNAIAGDRMKDIINKPKTQGSMKPKLSAMGKSAMVPSVQDKVNAVVGNQDPGEVPANVKDAAKKLLTPDDDKKKKDDKKDGPAAEGSKHKKLGKVSIEEANKELSSAKSVASRPIPGMGTKVANPQAMSPGKGPKPVSGTIGKNEDRLKEVLGKCAMCNKTEHTKSCEV